MSAPHDSEVGAAALRAADHAAGLTKALQDLARALSASKQWALYRYLGMVEELHTQTSSRLTALLRGLATGAHHE